MEKLYEKLYEDCAARSEFFGEAHFVAMQGEHYARNSRKFMLVGRATNGWGSLDTGSKEAFGADAQSQLESFHRWNWIESVNGTLYSTHDRGKSLPKRYCIDKKPYWAYTKSVWKQLPGTVCDDEVWQKNIVWSNLYKVSPSGNGNPEPESRQIQREACVEILKRELELFRPTHILFTTGFEWFRPFAGLFEDVYDTGRRNVMQGKNKNEVYVEGTASYRGAKVVVACRPEWRRGSKYVADILAAFGGDELPL